MKVTRRFYYDQLLCDIRPVPHQNIIRTGLTKFTLFGTDDVFHKNRIGYYTPC